MEARRWSTVTAVALGIAAATAAVYLPVLDNGFVNYDDDLCILANDHIANGLGLAAVRWAFTAYHCGNWFPLTWLSWAADFSLYGSDAAGFHLTSLALHIASAAGLCLAFHRLTGALWRSALVAAVFALHPLHVEAVAWASARKDVLCGFFAVLSLLCYERAVRRSAAWAPAVFACLGLGLLAKPVLVTWPFVLLLLDAWPLGRLASPSRPGRLDAVRVRRALLEKLPLFALCAAVAAVAFSSQSQGGTLLPVERLPLSLRISNALTSYVCYVRDALWPAGLAVFYPHPLRSLGPGQVAAAGAFLLAATGAAFAVRRRQPGALVGWLWFVGMLLPTIGLVQAGQAARADRYTYLPLIGLGIPVAWGAGALAARGRAARACAVTASVAAVAALGIASNLQVRHWRDSEALFRHALAVTENNHVAHINLGVVLSARGEYDEAARHLEQALRLVPISATAAGALGEVRLAQGRSAAAVALYGRAAELEPLAARWREGLGDAQRAAGDFAAAQDSYGRALELGPATGLLRGKLGLAQQRLGRLGEAVASYEAALRADPDLPEVHGNLGAALRDLGDLDGARRHYERAIALRPDYALMHAHLGRLLWEQRQFAAGLAHLEEAVRLEPRNAQFRAALALARAQRRPPAEATVSPAAAPP